MATWYCQGVQKEKTVGAWRCKRYQAQGSVRVAVHRKVEGALKKTSYEEYFGVADGEGGGGGRAKPRRLRHVKKRMTATVLAPRSTSASS